MKITACATHGACFGSISSHKVAAVQSSYRAGRVVHTASFRSTDLPDTCFALRTALARIEIKSSGTLFRSKTRIHRQK
jgi:hypothetical protein